MFKGLENYSYNGRGIEFPGRMITLHAMLGGCGYNKTTSRGYRWQGLKRGHIEFAIWQLTLSGRGAIETGGKVYDLNPGDAFMVHIPDDHCYFLPKDSASWEFIYVNLHGSEIMRIWREILLRVGPVATFPIHGEKISPTFELACDIFKKCVDDEINTPNAASLLAYQFVMTLLDELLVGGNFLLKTPPFVEAVTKYALKNLHENIGVEDLAGIAGYSRFHFSRIFKDWYGKGPAGFLHDMRIKRAVRLLQTEHSTVKEIACRCGFDDTSYFCKVFKKELGSSPEAFRKRNGQKHNSAHKGKNSIT